MKLGKRYIAVLHDESAPDDDAFFAPPTMFDLRNDAEECWRDFTSGNVQHHATLPVHLDSLAPADASEVEQHERPFVYHGEALARLGAPTPVVDELERMRAELAAARRLCDAAIAWKDGTATEGSWLKTVNEFHDQVDAYRAGHAAQPTTPRGRHAPGEPLSCDACGGAESVCNCECGEHYCGCECHRVQEQWALRQPAQPTPLRCAWCASNGQTHLQSGCTCAGTLTPAEFEALDMLRSNLDLSSTTRSLLGREQREAIVSAIDKLRAARGSRP